MYEKRLKSLRSVMKTHNVQGFLVPQTDEFMGEYIPECAQRLAWISGFTGSAGKAIVLKDKACAFTDSRYTLQIKKEVDSTLFDIKDSVKTISYEWIKNNAQKNDVIGFDPWLHTYKEIHELEEKGVTLKILENNLIDMIWEDRPPSPADPVFLFSDKTAGRTAQEKRKIISKALKKENCDAFVLADPQSIAWLLNVRGTDVPHTPLPRSYAVIHADSTLDWFIESSRVPQKVQDHLGKDISILDPDTLGASYFSDMKKVGLDHTRASIAFKYMLGERAIDLKDPCIDIRACKTESEIEAMKQAHIRDGKALTAALKWIEEETPKGKLTELLIDKKLREYREATGALQDVSFDSIVGWKANGAIVHYRVSEETSLPITGQGLLLIDSGGQYLDGTTDVTRTIALGGDPTEEEKKNFTLVLKGHIALACAIFPDGTTGAQIDVYARQALWAEGLDYGHGTGHGVGCYLSVHEEATSIAPRSHNAVKAGMILSNEPGYYKEDVYGIRIESLVVVVDTGKTLEDGRKLLGFETITMVPLDEKLIAWDMLTEEETQWVRDYQDRVLQVT